MLIKAKNKETGDTVVIISDGISSFHGDREGGCYITTGPIQYLVEGTAKALQSILDPEGSRTFELNKENDD
jgi:hypothetical protein